MKRMHIFVKGIVQGVNFRYNTRKKAGEYGLTGFTKNITDGRVEIVCEGAEADIRALVEWCRQGPQGAYVENVETKWEEYTGEFNDFTIRY
ncbi:MAG TPA: acylphosphatase [Syntrophorhabdaceae bacterium]|nr:acylphosphatase [Syntrophorhabdaceae bacterium]